MCLEIFAVLGTYVHRLFLKDVTLFGLKILVDINVAIVGITLSASANFIMLVTVKHS